MPSPKPDYTPDEAAEAEYARQAADEAVRGSYDAHGITLDDLPPAEQAMLLLLARIERNTRP